MSNRRQEARFCIECPMAVLVTRLRHRPRSWALEIGQLESGNTLVPLLQLLTPSVPLTVVLPHAVARLEHLLLEGNHFGGRC